MPDSPFTDHQESLLKQPHSSLTDEQKSILQLPDSPLTYVKEESDDLFMKVYGKCQTLP